ncbi:hypothetical protein CLG85_015955 [Yangia mangrovi]|uniref:Uncharacterized protein n=1 Tax=Alloyangia mangrovi TaxID=1779329 RepID=A0A2A3JVD0_9RHOB|nr:hypothetical protein [Alloyangia mangrovi]
MLNEGKFATWPGHLAPGAGESGQLGQQPIREPSPAADQKPLPTRTVDLGKRRPQAGVYFEPFLDLPLQDRASFAAPQLEVGFELQYFVAESG